MKKSLIVALSSVNNVIGKDNKLPWHLSGDLKYFKQITMKKPIIMGRKTFDSIGKALLGRFNIVVTRDGSWQSEGVITATSLEYAFKIAEQMVVVNSVDEVVVIGGAEIYKQVILDIDCLYVTEVDINIDGDAHFPLIDKNLWDKVKVSEDIIENNLNYRFIVYSKK